MYKSTVPYNSLPLLPPVAELDNKSILKKAIKANKALARLEGSARSLPNQHMLITSILMQEAKWSSEIENIATTNDEIYEAISSDAAIKNPALKEVIDYNEALWTGYEEIKKGGFLNTNLFIKLNKIFKDNQGGIRTTTGTKIQNTNTKEIIYTPPETERVIRDLLKNFEDYIYNDEDDLDALIKMAVLHYQFEAIHPFYDGNGRTGRILNILYLVQQELLRLPVLYLSKFIIENKKDYYRLLREVTEKQAWQPWIEYILEGIETTAQFTQQKIDSIIQTMHETGEEIRTQLPEIYSKELLEILFSQPYCKRKFLANAGIAGLKTAGQYLSKLEDKGFLQSTRSGKEKLYINQRLYRILKNEPTLK